LPGLPEALTALGGYGIRVSMIVQELEEIARVYDRETLDSVLSQTDVKQFFAVSSLKTAQLVSAMLGQREVTRESHNFGGDLFGLSGLGLGRGLAPLMTPDQIRRMSRDEQIIFIENQRPAKVLKPGAHEVDPWWHQVEGNPLHGGTRLEGDVKMVLRGSTAYVTHHGRRRNDAQRRPLLWPIIASLGAFMPDRSAALPAVLVSAILLLGWPMLRVETTQSLSWCRYYGLPVVTSPVTVMGDTCPLVIWRK
jgi:type IV secretion system protein VirD4